MPVPGAVTATATAQAPYLAGQSSITVGWSGGSGATSFKVGRSTVNGGPYYVVADYLSGTSWVDGVGGGLTDNTTYYYVVTAVNASGTTSATVVNAKTPVPIGAGVETGAYRAVVTVGPSLVPLNKQAPPIGDGTLTAVAVMKAVASWPEGVTGVTVTVTNPSGGTGNLIAEETISPGYQVTQDVTTTFNGTDVATWTTLNTAVSNVAPAAVAVYEIPESHTASYLRLRGLASTSAGTMTITGRYRTR